MAPDPRDLELRRYALDHVRELNQRHDGLIRVDVLRAGFPTPRGTISSGIASRLLEKIDLPRRSQDRPDPARLELRFERFRDTA